MHTSEEEPRAEKILNHQGRNVVVDFDVVDEADGVMKGVIKEFASIEVKNDLTLELCAANGKTVISGIELIRRD